MLDNDRLRETMQTEGEGGAPAMPAQDLRRAFERGWKRTRIWFAVWDWVGLLLAMWGARIVDTAASTPSQFRGLTLFLFGVGILIVMKLWWWVVENRIVLLQGVKELQVQVASLEAQVAENVGQKGGRDA